MKFLNLFSFYFFQNKIKTTSKCYNFGLVQFTFQIFVLHKKLFMNEANQVLQTITLLYHTLATDP